MDEETYDHVVEQERLPVGATTLCTAPLHYSILSCTTPNGMHCLVSESAPICAISSIHGPSCMKRSCEMTGTITCDDQVYVIVLLGGSERGVV